MLVCHSLIPHKIAAKTNIILGGISTIQLEISQT